MQIEIQNLGEIKKASIEVKPLTILSGPNNSGKTYISYALYGFLRQVHSGLDISDSLDLSTRIRSEKNFVISTNEMKDFFQKVVSKCAVNYSENIKDLFNAADGFFDKVVFKPDLPIKELRIENSKATGIGRSEDSVFELQFDEEKQEIRFVTKDEEELPNTPFFIIDSFIDKALANSISGIKGVRPFIITAERLGISLFYKELDMHKNRLVDSLVKVSKNKKARFSPYEFIEEFSSRYASPIQHNIDFVRDLEEVGKRIGDFYKENQCVSKALEDLVGGRYIARAGNIFFKPKKSKEHIPLHIGSSSVRALTELYFYVKHFAKKGDLLLIDEPESHLSTCNQVKFARLISRLVSCGINVLVTTHSDYLIKELNSLIMLSSVKKDRNKVFKSLGYIEEDAIPSSDVAAYQVGEGQVSKCEINNFGVSIPMFDEVVFKLVENSETLAGIISSKEV